MEQTIQDLPTAEVKRRCDNLYAELRRRQLVEAHERFKSYVGKFYQSFRQYGGIAEGWPVYTYVHSAEPNGVFVTRFQVDFFGCWTIEPNWLDTNFTPGTEITQAQFDAAWKLASEKIQSVWQAEQARSTGGSL